jgi:hypothetical protein
VVQEFEREQDPRGRLGLTLASLELGLVLLWVLPVREWVLAVV